MVHNFTSISNLHAQVNGLLLRVISENMHDRISRIFDGFLPDDLGQFIIWKTYIDNLNYARR